MHHYLLVVIEPTTDLSNVVWRCPKQHYYCNDYERGCVHTNYYICDGQYHCEMDENYCDQTVSPSTENNYCRQQHFCTLKFFSQFYHFSYVSKTMDLNVDDSAYRKN
jgi:hypothetical protein